MREREMESRSVRRTKDKLKRGLAELLRKKPVKSIKVRELADLVDINRGTFYLYYKDIYDLVEKIENEMFEDFYEIVRLKEAGVEAPSPVMTDVFSFLAENADLCLVLIGPNGDLEFVNRLKDLVRERCLYYWTKIYNAKSTKYFEHFYAFFIYGCIGMFEEWLKTGMKETPEEMADILDKMIMNGVKALEVP
jgi:AcrR family transcriptional regulator